MVGETVPLPDLLLLVVWEVLREATLSSAQDVRPPMPQSVALFADSVSDAEDLLQMLPSHFRLLDDQLPRKHRVALQKFTTIISMLTLMKPRRCPTLNNRTV